MTFAALYINNCSADRAGFRCALHERLLQLSMLYELQTNAGIRCQSLPLLP